MTNRRLAGLKSTRTIYLKAIEANKKDIGYGHPYERFLAENEKKLAAIELKINEEMEK